MLHTGDPRFQASLLLKGGSVWWIYNVRVIMEGDVTVNASVRAFCSNACFVLRHRSFQSFHFLTQILDIISWITLLFLLFFCSSYLRWGCRVFHSMCKSHIPLHSCTVSPNALIPNLFGMWPLKTKRCPLATPLYGLWPQCWNGLWAAHIG